MWQQWISRLDLLSPNQTKIMPPGLSSLFAAHLFCICGFHLVFVLDIVDFQAVAKGLEGAVMIDLDGGGPTPPAKLVCRLKEGGEVVKKIKPNMLSAEKN